MYCKNCGAEVSDDAVICVKCGCRVAKNSQEKSGWCIASFVISLVAIILNIYAITSVISIILAIIGLIDCGRTGKGGRGFAIAGIIISVVTGLVSFVLSSFIMQLFNELANQPAI